MKRKTVRTKHLAEIHIPGGQTHISLEHQVNKLYLAAVQSCDPSAQK